MKETDILQLCRIEASKYAVVFRMNSGSLQDKSGRWVNFGYKGMADLCGWMLDGTARYVALEIKQPGKNPTPEQSAFIAAVRRAGGIAGVCCSAEDVRTLLTT